MPCTDGESVLECLLRHKIDISYSCKMGTCQTCLVRAENYDIPANAQFGLPKNLVIQNYFLACLLYPESNIDISASIPSDLFRFATVTNKKYLADDILQLFLEPVEKLQYYSGQFINLKSEYGIVRSYSLANTAENSDILELHIKRMRNGKMSNWIFDDLQVGDEIEYQGATGNCFYIEHNLEQPMLLIGTGTGLAPLLSIIRYAISRGHRGEIVLYHGTRHPPGLYQNDLLIELASTVENFTYHACLSGKNEFTGALHGRASDLALLKHKELTGWKVFLCGEPEMIKDAQQRSYLAGANLDEIHTDPYVLRDLRRRRRK
ncbi:hypothetical protein MNBD_GAMMA21-775 [hydrothermal vent metagenome]|uniref:2-polyprenylphenol hydroxylase and related flavodoxin oxidoreductases / CDP-6-deoxy-delta-3,4-glucoseen reductase-like n=1 Tax=hydrothermal vent metagenome TaxID=652676 RepID=A0A3B1A3Q1_9ZZZZ